MIEPRLWARHQRSVLVRDGLAAANRPIRPEAIARHTGDGEGTISRGRPSFILWRSKSRLTGHCLGFIFLLLPSHLLRPLLDAAPALRNDNDDDARFVGAPMAKAGVASGSPESIRPANQDWRSSFPAYHLLTWHPHRKLDKLRRE